MPIAWRHGGLYHVGVAVAPSMNYPDSVRFLYAIGNEIKTAKLGLERIRTLLAALGNPHQHGRFIHVAGTNGKGSTCAMIEAGLRAAGIRTGLFTSPHLVEPTERIRIAGQPVTTDQFTEAFESVHAVAERLLEENAIDCHPTYFETVTAMALLLFHGLKVEAAVLEVGLGGRLDATNVVTPRLCVITPTDFDHEAYLGSTLEKIAAEKAGILKAGIPSVFARQRPEVEAVFRERVDELGLAVTRTSNWRLESLWIDARGSRFHAAGPVSFDIECPLAGEHQVENALSAAVALAELGIAPDGIRTACWPGRLEQVAESPEILLDGAHNPAGTRALAAYIQRFYSGRRVWIIYGAMRDKAIEEMTALLFPLAHHIVVTAAVSPRALRPEVLRDLYDHPNVSVVSNLRDALALVREQASAADAVFVTGSLFLVGEARALLVQ